MLVWAGSQHRLHLPFLQYLHRFSPPRPARPPPSVVHAALSAAVLAALPWIGQGPIDLPLYERPRVFFDGVASPTRAAAAVFVPPSFAFWCPLPPGTDQQQSEIDAAALAVACAAALRGQRPVIVGDSTSALFSLCRMSCPSRLLQRGNALRRIALTVLASELTYSLAWVPGSGPARNPADPVSRIEAPGPTLLQCGDPALCEALALSQVCDPTALFHLRPLPPLRAGVSRAAAVAGAAAATRSQPAPRIPDIAHPAPAESRPTHERALTLHSRARKGHSSPPLPHCSCRVER
eukprot:gene19291-biopygen22727